MLGAAKPGVDWIDIRRRVEAGEGMRALGREYGVSHQAIGERSQKEGWAVPGRGKRLPTGKRLIVAGNGKDGESPLPRIPPRQQGLRTEANREYIVACLETGMSLRKAATLVGFDEKSVRLWVKDDYDMAEAVQDAYAQYTAAHRSTINGASERGDWGAARYLLETHPFTRDEMQTSKDSNLNINVNINMPRPSPVIDLEVESDSQDR